MNWSINRVAVRGDQAEIKTLYDTVFSCRNREADEHAWGGLWLGNLVKALDGDTKSIRCRGGINDDTVVIRDDGVLRFDFDFVGPFDFGLFVFLKEKFPSLEFFLKTTDECHNYYYRFDPDCVLDDVRWEMGDVSGSGEPRWREYHAGQKKEFLKDLENRFGFFCPDTVTNQELDELFHKFIATVSPNDERIAKAYGVVIWVE